MTTGSHAITNGKYSIEDVVALVEERPQLELDGAIRAAIIRGAAFVRSKAEEGSHIYGVNTGFGAMCETRIPASDMHELQRNLILSHAARSEEHTSEDTCRATLLLKLLTFRTGHTGISIEVVERLLEFWNHGVVPATPDRKS